MTDTTNFITEDSAGCAEMIGDVATEEIDGKELAERLLAQAREQGVSLVGPDGLLSSLTKTVLETALEAEMVERLGHEHGEIPLGSNVRNGTRVKTVLTEIGPVHHFTAALTWSVSISPSPSGHGARRSTHGGVEHGGRHTMRADLPQVPLGMVATGPSLPRAVELVGHMCTFTAWTGRGTNRPPTSDGDHQTLSPEIRLEQMGRCVYE